MVSRRAVLPALVLALLAFPAVHGPATATGAPASRTDVPSYTWNAEPSPVTLLLPRRQVTLRPTTYCWTAPSETTDDGGEIGSAVCSDGLEPTRAQLAKVDRTANLRFWFGRPGWRWSAQVRSFAHPRRAGCTVRRTPTAVSPRLFELAAPRYRGTYRVRLFGRGPEGDVLVSFSWRYGHRAGRCT